MSVVQGGVVSECGAGRSGECGNWYSSPTEAPLEL